MTHWRCYLISSAFNVNTSKSNHQLTKKISRDEFKNRPLLDPIFFDLQTNQPVQNRALLTHNREKLQIEFQAPYAGIFQAFLMHNVKDNAYCSIASFSISANKASNIQHPTYFHSSAKDIKIESPLVQLHADSTYEFKIKVALHQHVWVASPPFFVDIRLN
ncbi:hypothetical protein MMG03_002764 [Fibrobacter succinogenes]|nr:hypothetical protein [Fibrobacter succinogenes]